MQGGWEVDVLVTTTDLWSAYRIIHIILSGFSTYYLYVKILVLGSISLIFCHANAKLARNTGL